MVAAFDYENPTIGQYPLLPGHSGQAAASVDAFLDQYGDRVVTGFDLTDATLRELSRA